MKTNIRNLILCATLTSMLTACSDSKNNEKKSVSVSAEMASTELIAAGEQLITPTSFHLADRAFEMALEKNPGDKKAEFLRALLKRYLVFRGIGTNLESLIEKHGKIEEYHEALNKMTSSPLMTFIMTPKDGIINKINEEKDLQKLLIEYRKAAMDFREYIARNPDLNLTVQLNPAAFNEQAAGNCREVHSDKNSFEAECDGTSDPTGTIKINAADLVVLKQEAAGEILYATLYASYNANGLIDAVKEIENKSLTNEQQVNVLMNKVDLSLLDKEGLQAVHSLGSDLISAAKWVHQNQKNLCVRDANGIPAQRKQHLVGSNLLFCIDDNEQFNKGVRTAETVLNGPISFVEADGKVTTINLLAPLNKPVSNLKQLAPLKWSEDGQEVMSYQDPTFAGFLPL